MTTSEIERKIQESVSNATPDMKKEIIEKCKNTDSSNIVCFDFAKKSKKEHYYAMIAIVAVLILTGRLLLLLIGNSINNNVITTVDIDVNPSIELQINKYDKVIKAEAINEDAIAILDDMDLQGVQTKIAVNAIVGSMFKQGYLVGNTDTLLISVDGKDKAIADRTKALLTEDVDGLLKAYNSDASVISQEIGKDSEIVDMAKKYHISIGKSTLIKKILDNSSKYSVQELVKLNISELHDIIDDISSLSIVNHTVVVNKKGVDAVSVSANGDELFVEKEEASENSASSNSTKNPDEDRNDDSVSDNTTNDDGAGDDSVSRNKVSKKKENNNKDNKKSDKKDKNKDDTNKKDPKKNSDNNSGDNSQKDADNKQGNASDNGVSDNSADDSKGEKIPQQNASDNDVSANSTGD